MQHEAREPKESMNLNVCDIRKLHGLHVLPKRELKKGTPVYNFVGQGLTLPLDDKEENGKQHDRYDHERYIVTIWRGRFFVPLPQNHQRAKRVGERPLSQKRAFAHQRSHIAKLVA